MKLIAYYSLLKTTAGQSLMEIVISLTIGAILITASVATIIPMLQNNVETKNVQTANSLAQDYIDNLQNLTQSNWFKIYNPPGSKGVSSQFYIASTTGALQLFSGASSTNIAGIVFTRYFSVENVNRDSCGIGNITTSPATSCSTGPGATGVADDPSTQKIVVYVNWPPNRSLSRTEYLTRSINKVFNQSDWSGGSGQAGPIAAENNKFFDANVSTWGGYAGSMQIFGLSTTSQQTMGTNIDSINHYAWNDVIGWIDFYQTQNVSVGDTQLYGYATSSLGYIALDCGTSPNGNVCPSSNFQVLDDVRSQGVGNNDRGYLSGWAWNDAIGWISFDSDTAGSPYNYQVRVRGNGRFHGWAWNDIVGWISFNSDNVGSGASYEVDTTWGSGSPQLSWLISSTFDTQSTSTINTIMWQGTQPSNTIVRFQFAASNCANGATNYPSCTNGTWGATGSDYIGPDGLNSSYYTPSGPGTAIPLNSQYTANRRYFRYKIYLQSDPSGLLTPLINDIIINFSP